MSEEERNKEITRRIYEEVHNQGNLDTADELVDPEFRDNTAVLAEVRGSQGLKMSSAIFRMAFPDIHYQVEDIVAEGDMVMARITFTGTNTGSLMGLPPTGKQMRWTGMDMIRIKDGRIIEHWGRLDMLYVMQSVGMLSPDLPGPTYPVT